MRRPVVAVLTLVALAASCAGDDDEGATAGTSATSSSAPASTPAPSPPITTAAAPTTTIDPIEIARTYADAGPFPVGATTLVLPKGPAVEVCTRRRSHRATASSPTTPATTCPRRCAPC